MKALEFIFSSFWIWLGFIFILAMSLTFIQNIWNRFWRHWNIRKHGYPPKHCDADGDLFEDDKDC